MNRLHGFSVPEVPCANPDGVDSLLGAYIAFGTFSPIHERKQLFDFGEKLAG